MAEGYAVRVNTDIQGAGAAPVWTLYVVLAETQEEAIEAVKRAIPPRWEVVAADSKLLPETVARLGLRPGQPERL
jgi:hypothetical protein